MSAIYTAISSGYRAFLDQPTTGSSHSIDVAFEKGYFQTEKTAAVVFPYFRSATINIELFARYFDNAPVVQVDIQFRFHLLSPIMIALCTRLDL